MMGMKLLWVGLTMLLTANVFRFNEGAMLGALLMVIGLVLYLLDK